jgi:hypothetical protein
MSGNRPSKRAALSEVEPPKSEMLCRLQRHEITLGQYLDHCAEEAVAHLKGLVDAERLQSIKEVIRDQMMTDPVIIRYVEQTTGLSPEVDKAS